MAAGLASAGETREAGEWGGGWRPVSSDGQSLPGFRPGWRKGSDTVGHAFVFLLFFPIMLKVETQNS